MGHGRLGATLRRLTAAALGVFVACHPGGHVEPPARVAAGSVAPEPVALTAVEEAAHRAARYLVSACDEDGRFAYRVNLDPRVRVRPKYNVLRHAGTMYALAMYQERFPDAEVLATLRRAARHLASRYLRPVEATGALAVWSDASESSLRVAKLGGAGLGLVALEHLEAVAPGSLATLGTPDASDGLARFVTFMQDDRGGFASKYLPDHGGRSFEWVSLYYPGEAALGLLALHARRPDPRWHRAAFRAVAHLARVRREQHEVPADHWVLLATARLLPGLDDAADRALALAHAVQIAEAMLRDAAAHAPGSLYHGAFTADGRTTPTATRLEGLLATLTFLPAEHGLLRKRIQAAADGGIAFLLRAQVQDGPLAGGMPRALVRLPDEHPDASRATEVRIDYVQHALSAWLQYHDLREPPPGR